MKPLLLILLALSIAVSSHAQTQNLSVFCRVNEDGSVDYGNLRSYLAGLLPDSVRDGMLVDPQKQYNISSQLDALELMTFSGWKLATAVTDADGFNGNVFSSHHYLLTRDIGLDEKSRALFVERLKKAAGPVPEKRKFGRW